MASPTTVNFRTLDLNLLRVFDVVMAERNLTRAAGRLSITQPAVSNALRRLKISIGEDLLTRTSSGVTPTPRAEALWPEIRTALGNLRAALAPGEFNPQADATSFRIAMADAAATTFIPHLVARIEQSRALANLRLLPLTTRDPSRLLERGEADLAVGHFPEAVAALSVEGADATLRHHRLQESGYVCVMRQGHPLAKGELTLDAYCAAHHLLVSFTGRAVGRADQALGALNRERRIVLTVNQYFTAGRVVANSNLLTVLPVAFVAAAGFREKVIVRPLPFELETLHVTMLWHMRHDHVSSHEWLRAQLIDSAQSRSD
jgi:DNA-binding transcriptional LysR family regulator